MRKIGKALYYFFGIDSIRKVRIDSLDMLVLAVFIGAGLLVVSLIFGLAGLLQLLTGKSFHDCGHVALGLVVLAYGVGYFGTMFWERLTSSWKRAKSEENKEKDGRF